LETALFAFALELFVERCWDEVDFSFEDDTRDRFVLERDDAVDTCDRVRLRDDTRRVRVCGASFTGSEIRSEEPVLTRFDER
jgi:hypothetical protein